MNVDLTLMAFATEINCSTETMLPPVTETEVKTETKTLVSTERQTIVHCTCGETEAYRVWPTTFLVERGSEKKAKLITAFNISFAPQWTLNDGKGFTLVFEGLSKECKVFDLLEIIPQAGGFEVLGIRRNAEDVYRVDLA
jgi:hypothetical protein